LGVSHQVEQLGAIDEPYGLTSREASRLFSVGAGSDDVDFIGALGVEKSEHLANGVHADLLGLPLLALHEYRLAVLAGHDIDPTVGSGAGVPGDASGEQRDQAFDNAAADRGAVDGTCKHWN
jgi:hypothetical protein